MQNKSILVNSNESWNAKKRYKINNVVSYGGGIYQNTTGANSNPSLGTDWLFLTSVGNTPTVYHMDFIADATQKFTVPAGVFIKNVFLNLISAKGSDWSQTGNEITVTSSQENDLVTLTN